MTLENCYVTLDEFKSYLFPANNAGANEDPQMEAAITAACRSIDTHCARRFYTDDTPTARVYDATDSYVVRVDDFSTTSGLVVKSDTYDNGTYDTTWSGSEFVAEPRNSERNGLTGLPFTSIRSFGVRAFPVGGTRHERVQVTALWGWVSVPAPVKQATLIKAARVYRRAKTPEGFAAGESFGALRISTKDDPDVVMLLGPYRKFGGAGLVVA